MLAVTCILLAGCTALPKADGFEAAIIKTAEGRPALAPASGDDVKSIARNGLLLSPSVREAASRVSADADQVRVQRAAFFPSVNLSGGGGIGSAGSGDPTVGLTGSQLLFDGGNSKRAVKVADFDLQISYLAFQKSVDGALVDVLKIYDEVQTKTELLAIYRKQFRALHELQTLITQRAESGAVSNSDLLEARKRMQSAEFLVNDTQLALEQARDRLILLSGQSNSAHVKINPASCKATGETDSLRISRLELARAQIALEKAEVAALTPRVFLKPVIGGEIGLNKLPVGLNLDIQSDVLQGGALTAKANVARNQLAGADAQMAVVRLEDSVMEQGLFRSLAAGDRKIAMLQRQISLLSQTRKLYRSQYFDMGTRQLSELLDNEEEYYTRQAELIEQKAELVATRLDCAVRSRVLRKEMGVEDNVIYGFPLENVRVNPDQVLLP